MCSFALVFAILAAPILTNPAASGDNGSGMETMAPGKSMLERSGVIWPYATFRVCQF